MFLDALRFGGVPEPTLGGCPPIVNFIVIFFLFDIIVTFSVKSPLSMFTVFPCKSVLVAKK